MSTTPIVLVHGGGLDGRCWDPLLPHLDGQAIACMVSRPEELASLLQARL